MTAADMKEDLIFFPGADAFHRWLREHHDQRDVLWVGLFKKGAGRPTLSWDEAVDEALCFGWIDGIRKGIDDQRYKIRFTPRRKGSRWSAKNIASVKRLTEAGRMSPAGIEAFQSREASTSGAYPSDQDPTELTPDLSARFRADAEAWERFNDQPPGYRRTMRRWVMSAKTTETRLRRLDRLIEVSERGHRVDVMSPFKSES